MPVPTFDQLLWPILKLSAKETITRKLATEHLIKELNLTEGERHETIATGQTKIGNRTGWAMSHLKKAGLISRVEKFSYCSTKKGLDYLKSHQGMTKKDLLEIEGFKEAWAVASEKRRTQIVAPISSDDSSTPEDLIDNAVSSLHEDLHDRILEQLGQIDPFHFERVVMHLLLKMGYGGYREDAGNVTKKSADEGIDGIINEDRLGLDVIYVQAKRWKGTVGRPDVQNFVGALAGKQAQKGVFITTSDFAKNAIEYAKAVSQKVILIDGDLLADLMIEHNIGVSTSRTIEIKRIDSDYFEET
jgi:restriction system protein